MDNPQTKFHVPKMVFIRATRDNVFAVTRTLAKGEVFEVHEEAAARLVEVGQAEHANAPTIGERAGKFLGRESCVRRA